MNYKVTYYNDFTEPFYGNLSINGRRQNKESWILKNKEACIQCVKDFLDVPEAELSTEQIKQDFGSHDYPISDQKVEQIKNYYNGRIKIYQQFLEDFKIHDELTYDIPSQFNQFNISDADEAKQHQSYIKISLTNIEI